MSEPLPPPIYENAEKGSEPKFTIPSLHLGPYRRQSNRGFSVFTREEIECLRYIKNEMCTPSLARPRASTLVRA